MKISFVDIRLTNGGSGRVLSILANYFVKNGWDVDIITLDENSVDYPLDERINLHNFKMEKGLSPFVLLSRSRKFREILLKEDVVVGFCFRPIFWITVTTLVKKPIIIYSERNNPYKDPRSALKRVLRNICYYHANALVFQTRDQMNYFSQKLSERGLVIRNPIKSGLPKYDDSRRKKIIITACRLEKQKNLYIAIKAFNIFSKTHEDYVFHIYGEGSLKKDIEKYIENTGLSKKVLIYNFTKNIHERMKEASIFILSSDYEGISNSMLEAMAIGLPVICTDCPIGGAREMINNEENGCLVPVGDFRSMASYMMRIIEDNEFRMRISKNAIKIRDELFSDIICSMWEETVKKYI